MHTAINWASKKLLDVSVIKSKKKHSGIAVITILVIISLLATSVIIYSLSQASIQAKRDKETAYALFEAKSALMGFAAKDSSSGASRPGDLPCPDLDNDGEAETACSTPERRLGRLPWKTLGVGDLRDGNSERLWYAVSDNFKNNPRTVCDSPEDAGCLNSDTMGTITVRNNSGTLILDASNLDVGGAVAVIFSAGTPIKRQDSANTQNRNCQVGVNCDSAQQCITTPATLTPLCNPSNYLETALGEDNADFEDGNRNDGFIQGKIYDSDGNVILNDQFILLKSEELVPILEKIVGKEVENCLINYGANNNQRYPYAALVSSGAASPNYSDSAGMLFGRIPDEPFSKTELDSKLLPLPLVPPTMSDGWSSSCSISSTSGWWINWKEQVFYGLASAYKPKYSVLSPSCGSCLTVNTETQKKRFVVIVAGKKILGQVRLTNSDKNNLSNYLEDDNADSDTAYKQQSTTSTFNDNLYYQ